MEKKEKIRELIKSILILVLLGLLCVNIYFLFVQKSKGLKVQDNIKPVKIASSKYINPYKLRFSQGTQSYLIFNTLDKKLCEDLNSYLTEILSNPYSVKEVKGVDYRGEETKLLVFYYPTVIKTDLFTYKDGSFNTKHNDLKSIKDVYFIADGELEVIVYTGDKYLRLLSDDKSAIKTEIPINKFRERISEIIYSTSLRYRQAPYILSANEELKYENRSYFVCRGYFAPSPYYLQPEYNFEDSVVSKDLVNRIFEAKSAFVREAENFEGDKIYLSQHGSEILKLSPSGMIDYKVEEYGRAKETSLEKDYMTVIAFDHKVSSDNSDMRLEKVEEEKKGDYFERTFYFYKNDMVGKIHSNGETNGVVAKVYGGSLVDYKRYLPAYQKDADFIKSKNGKTYERRSILNMLSKEGNVENLREIFARRYSVKDYENIKVSDILLKIDTIDFGYYRVEEDLIRPCYIISIGTYEYIIDFYTEEGVLDELGED